MPIRWYACSCLEMTAVYNLLLRDLIGHPRIEDWSSFVFANRSRAWDKSGEENMPTRKKGSHRRYGKAAGKAVERAMRRKKRGTLRSGRAGKGGKVKSRKQAIAIGLSEARKKGAKVPRKKAA